MPERDDPFEKIKEELSRMELPPDPIDEPSEPQTLEERLRKAMDETSPLTPDEDIELKLSEMDQNVAHAAQQSRVPDPPDFDERLARLEETAGKVKARREAERLREDDRLKTEGESHRGLGHGLTIAYTIIGTPLIGLLIGWLIDRALGTEIWKGLLTVAGAAAGVAVAVFMLNRLQK